MGRLFWITHVSLIYRKDRYMKEERSWGGVINGSRGHSDAM
jgi:hypothetical protein